MTELTRCFWSQKTPEESAYHDSEWGVPLHDDQRLFEFLVLEGAQAGLSWATILRKRPRYREVFDRFDPQRVAAYGAADVARLMADPGIVRNRLKIDAAILNARCFLEVQARYGSFDAYVWRFVNGEPLQNAWLRHGDLPAETDESRSLSRDLRALGFKFVGPTICYAFMQAIGMVNDHTVDCYRWRQLGGAS